jgi:hypothetical protein
VAPYRRQVIYSPILQSTPIPSSHSGPAVPVGCCGRLADPDSDYSGHLFWTAHSPPGPPDAYALAEHAGTGVEALGCWGQLAGSRA